MRSVQSGRSDITKMGEPKTVFLLYITAVFTLQQSLTLQQQEIFTLQPKPSAGPQRLSAGWTDRSLTSCMASCMTEYSATCRNVMYNTLSQFCTPGGLLDQSEPLPSPEEGDLHSSFQCEVGFDLHDFNGSWTCLFYSDQSGIPKHESEVHYADVQAECHRRNSWFFTVKTLERLSFIQQRDPHDHLWVGLDDLTTEGRYIWVDDGTELQQELIPLMFKSDQPKSDTRKNCVRTEKGPGSLFEVYHCDRDYSFYCEKDPVGTLAE